MSIRENNQSSSILQDVGHSDYSCILLHDLIISLYGNEPEPASFTDFVTHVRETGFDFSDIIGDFDNRNDRARAALRLRTGNERIVGTMIGGVVNGFIFNPYHQESIDAIIKIKSIGGTDRRNLFACVTDISTIRTLIPESLHNIPFDQIAERCFIRIPIKEDKVDKLPTSLISKIGDIPVVQFFPLQIGSALSEIIKDSVVDTPLPVMAGTSANYTSYDSLTNRWTSAVFCLANGIFWLDQQPHPNYLTRGSFTIVQYLNNKLTQERSGNIPFEDLQKILSPTCK